MLKTRKNSVVDVVGMEPMTGLVKVTKKSSGVDQFRGIYTEEFQGSLPDLTSDSLELNNWINVNARISDKTASLGSPNGHKMLGKSSSLDNLDEDSSKVSSNPLGGIFKSPIKNQKRSRFSRKKRYNTISNNKYDENVNTGIESPNSKMFHEPRRRGSLQSQHSQDLDSFSSLSEEHPVQQLHSTKKQRTAIPFSRLKDFLIVSDLNCFHEGEDYQVGFIFIRYRHYSDLGVDHFKFRCLIIEWCYDYPNYMIWIYYQVVVLNLVKKQEWYWWPEW